MWKAYIDMEASEGQNAHVRKLYERLLEKTGHFKVCSYICMYVCVYVYIRMRNFFIEKN